MVYWFLSQAQEPWRALSSEVIMDHVDGKGEGMVENECSSIVKL